MEKKENDIYKNGGKELHDSYINTQSENKVGNTHPVFSTIVDIYFLEILIGFLFSLISISYKGYFNRNYLIGFSTVLFIFLLLYHTLLSKKLIWLTPGEIATGGRIISKTKEWINPYGVNRFGIFIIIFLSLFLLRDADAIKGSILTYTELAGYSAKAVLLASEVILLGKGKLVGIIPINILLSINSYEILIIRSKYSTNLGIILIILILVFSCIGVYLSSNKKNIAKG